MLTFHSKTSLNVASVDLQNSSKMVGKPHNWYGKENILFFNELCTTIQQFGKQSPSLYQNRVSLLYCLFLYTKPPGFFYCLTFVGLISFPNELKFLKVCFIAPHFQRCFFTRQDLLLPLWFGFLYGCFTYKTYLFQRQFCRIHSLFIKI